MTYLLPPFSSLQSLILWKSLTSSSLALGLSFLYLLCSFLVAYEVIYARRELPRRNKEKTSPVFNALWQTWIARGKRSGHQSAPPFNKGEAKQLPIFWIILCCFCMVAVPITIALAKYYSRYPIYTIENVKVVSITPNGYWMEYESESVGHLRFYTRLCESYTFGEGDFFELLRYEDRQSCWSLKGDHTGWKLRRDKYGNTASESARQTTEEKQ